MRKQSTTGKNTDYSFPTFNSTISKLPHPSSGVFQRGTNSWGEDKGSLNSYPWLERKSSKMAGRKPIFYEDACGQVHTNRISKKDEEALGFFMRVLE